MAKDERREPLSEFAWSLGISWCDNLQVKPEIAFQIWSQWVKKLTKFAPIGRDRGKSRKPMICSVGEDCGWFNGHVDSVAQCPLRGKAEIICSH